MNVRPISANRFEIWRGTEMVAIAHSLEACEAIVKANGMTMQQIIDANTPQEPERAALPMFPTTAAPASTPVDLALLRGSGADLPEGVQVQGAEVGSAPAKTTKAASKKK